MALTDRKLTIPDDFAGYEVSSLDDRPTLSASALKQRFDASMEDVMAPAFNAAIDDLVATTDSASGADQIGCTAVGAGTAETVQGVLEELNTAMPDTAAIETAISTGWDAAPSAWTYASATSITVPSGAAALYDIGDMFKLTANSVELQGYIVGVADTTLTVVGDSLTNHTFSSCYVAKSGNPHGFDHWFSWSPTFTGFTATVPTNTSHRFRIQGRQVFLQIAHGTAGTSNANNFRITLPVTAKTSSNAIWSNGGTGNVCMNNGSAVVTGGTYIGSGGTYIEMTISGSATGWTTSNGKSVVYAELWYEI